MHYILIGTDHKLQLESSPDSGLKQKLETYVGKGGIVLLAEEVDADNTDVRTFGRTIGGDSTWLSIDMTTNQRKEAGIYQQLCHPAPQEFDAASGKFNRINGYYTRAEGIRENFWLDRIDGWCNQHGVTEGTIIVTCGQNHPSFLAEKIRLRNPASTVTIDEYLPYNEETVHGVFRVFD